MGYMGSWEGPGSPDGPYGPGTGWEGSEGPCMGPWIGLYGLGLYGLGRAGTGWEGSEGPLRHVYTVQDGPGLAHMGWEGPEGLRRAQGPKWPIFGPFLDPFLDPFWPGPSDLGVNSKGFGPGGLRTPQKGVPKRGQNDPFLGHFGTPFLRALSGSGQ